jgi:hypothetical protein
LPAEEIGATRLGDAGPMALPSVLRRARRWHGYVGSTINVVLALISIILLAVIVTELQIKFGTDPADLIVD